MGVNSLRSHGLATPNSPPAGGSVANPRKRGFAVAGWEIVLTFHYTFLFLITFKESINLLHSLLLAFVEKVA